MVFHGRNVITKIRRVSNTANQMSFGDLSFDLDIKNDKEKGKPKFCTTIVGAMLQPSSQKFKVSLR